MVRTTDADDRTAAETEATAVRALRDAGDACIDAEFDGDRDDLDDRYTVACFVDAVEDLTYHGDDDGVELVDAGRYAPEGIAGNYPPLWAEIHVTEAVYRAVDALNDDTVAVHLLENKGDRTIVKVRPDVDFEA